MSSRSSPRYLTGVFKISLLITDSVYGTLKHDLVINQTNDS